jgi:hypothetical protein
MEKEIIVSIHQPNFLPWLGFWNKIARSDIFIIMDNVQFPKTGAGCWTNRVKIIVNGEPKWITVPIIRRYNGFKLIKEIEIDNTINWRLKILKTIEYNYKKCPFFEEEWETIKNLINYKSNYLCEFNINAINFLIKYLELDKCKVIRGSSLNCSGKATDLLVSMVKAVGGNCYLYGSGALDYQENYKFEKNGIKLIYQNFNHPTYPQLSKSFIMGLSFIDALFNIGRKKLSKLLKENNY